VFAHPRSGGYSRGLLKRFLRFAGAEAACADTLGTDRAILIADLDLAYIGEPSAARLAVRVTDGISDHYSLTTDRTFS